MITTNPSAIQADRRNRVRFSADMLLPGEPIATYPYTTEMHTATPPTISKNVTQ